MAVSPYGGVQEFAKGELAYAQVTASQSPITASVDLTGLSVTVDVPAGRRIRVTGHGLTFCDAGGRAIVEIREGTTALGRVQDFTAHAADENSQYDGSVVFTPAAGIHEYKLHYRLIVGADHRHAAFAEAPAFILVEDLGPA